MIEHEPSQVVGYERPGPWVMSTLPWRYCIACSLPVVGLEATPVTRTQVEAERKVEDEQGARVPHRDWRGSARCLCWVCGTDLGSGKRPRKRQIDGLAVAQRMPYQLRHLLVQHPDLLTSVYPEMTETERLEVLAYTTRAQRLRRTYQDRSEAERLAASEALLQRWYDWSGAIDSSPAWRIPPPAWKALTTLMKETSRLLLEQAQEQGREDHFLS